MTTPTKVYDPDLRALATAFKGLQTHDKGNRPASFERREADPRAGIKQAAWASMLQHADEFTARGFDALPCEPSDALTSEERDTLREGFTLHMRKVRGA
jgi:hypothetical protein